MFERRLKIFLAVLAVAVVVLIARAAQVQILLRQYWKTQAREAMKRTHLVDTTRGNILDRNGHILAIDKPCIDACIDYRALTSHPDPEWLKAKATERLIARLGDGWAKFSARQKAEQREQEVKAVLADIEEMWPRLAQISGRPLDEIEETRDAIVRRVETRQRFVWYKRYEEALKNGGKKVETARWKKWIADGGDDTPAIDNFNVVVAEQLESHVILHAVDTSTQNELGKDIDQYPGLVLRPGTHRTYPYDDVACHLLGHLARVDAADINENKGLDELREFLPNDLVGKAGVESLCEPALRGTRGKIDKVLGEETVLGSQQPAPGQDVHLSIDIELQQQIQSAFASATLRDAKGKVVEENAVLHGAAVILDVDTNQVLALVSYPTYDLNQIEELYPKLRDDEINEPLRNRATMSAFEPGSTVKPLCGLAALTEGVVGVNQGIECTGVFQENGRPIAHGARCWVASMWGQFLLSHGMSIAHHPIPFPHVGHDGNPDGFLTYSDALERSCNIYFETSADRLGIERLSSWYYKFGLGRPTGIGIGEARGRLPRDTKEQERSMRRAMGFLGGIGQGSIAATPIQMANAVAMIARDGIWMRPVLVLPGDNGQAPTMRAGGWQGTPDRVDLQLSRDALKAAKLGMFNVVNAPAGTGKALVANDKLLQDLKICGKTGTATAAPFTVPERDAAGKVLLDENHRPRRRVIEPSKPGEVNPIAPWYRAEVAKRLGPDDKTVVEVVSLDHAWYIGFAPQEKPKIAFAVLVEYGGSGGVAAAAIAREALADSISRNYLQVSR